MAYPTLSYTLTNGTPNDATQVQQNFEDLLQGLTTGTRDACVVSMSAVTGSFQQLAIANTAVVNDLDINGHIIGDVTIQTVGGTSVYIHGDNGHIDRIRSTSGTLSLEGANGAGATLSLNQTGTATVGGELDANVLSVTGLGSSFNCNGPATIAGNLKINNTGTINLAPQYKAINGLSTTWSGGTDFSSSNVIITAATSNTASTSPRLCLQGGNEGDLLILSNLGTPTVLFGLAGGVTFKLYGQRNCTFTNTTAGWCAINGQS
jgi:hypothetical protein